VNGWIKLHRELLGKSIWQNSTAQQKAVLVTILLLASHIENDWEWRGNRFAVQPGQLITSLPSLAASSGVTVQNVRTALKRFEKMEFLTDESTANGRLITIANWGVYQGATANLTDQLTDDQQTANRQLTDSLTSIKKLKKEKNEKEDKERIGSSEKPKLKKYGEYKWVLLSDEEFTRLIKEYGADMVDHYIKVVDESAQSTGNKNKWKDWNLIVRRAIRDKWGARGNGLQTKNTSLKNYEEAF